MVDLDGFVQAIHAPPQVTELSLGRRWYASNGDSRKLVKHLPRLKKINLEGRALNSSILHALTNLADLDKLVLADNTKGVSGAWIQQVLLKLPQIWKMRIKVPLPSMTTFGAAPTLTLDGTITNLELAKQQGVQVEGNLIEGPRQEMAAGGNI